MMGSENAVRQAGSRGMNEVNMIRTGDLIRAVGSVADGEKTAEKYAAHLRELFDALREEAIGGDFSEALARGDAEKAVRSCAAHFRAGPDDALPVAAQFRFDRNTAERAVRGAVRVIGIDWEFPDRRIDYLFDPTALRGARNHEWLWQLNRHAFWLHMAEAYRESGNEACASAFERQLLDWIAQTDCPREAWNAPGSAWRTIECGIRLMGSWPIALRVFRHASAFSDVSLLLMLASMRRQALHLLAHPTRANWLMMECCGVFTFAALYPEFREAEAFAKTACARFFAEMEAQILPDGMHNELSPDYQSVVWNCAANLYEIAREKKTESALPSGFVRQMQKTVRAAVLLSTPAFTQPRTNDCYTVPTANFTLRAAKLLPPSDEYDFVNSGGAAGRAPEGKTASAFLPWAGFCVMRSGWDRDAAYLCFDVGPLGRAHMHQDKLNINLYKGGEELIFDDGGGQYELSAAREYGISAYDHNTVLVDAMAQNRREPLVSREAIDAGWVSNERFDYARGSYEDGFGPDMARLAVHTRQVRFEKPDFFIVRDDLSSADGNAHEYELLFHLNTLSVERTDRYPGAVISRFGRREDILILPLTEDGEEEVTVVSGRTEPALRGWYVGRNEETLHRAATVGRKCRPAARHTFLTLLIPVRRDEALPEVRRDGRMLRVRIAGRNHETDLENLPYTKRDC